MLKAIKAVEKKRAYEDVVAQIRALIDDGLWHIYNEAGQRVEGDFKTYPQALQWVKDNK